MAHKIILTGITGFLGSHLARSLVANGYKVIGMKRSTSSLRRLKDVLPQLTLVNVDELEFDQIFEEHGKIDVIIHTATCYGRNGETVEDIFNANTAFPLKLLDYGTRFEVNAFINTDTILDKHLNTYAFSKNQLLEWGKFFASNEKITFWNLRLEHFYGPDDEKHKFTSFILNSCLNNVSELQLTPGEQQRDFIYIDDTISAYLLLLREILVAEPGMREFDVGSGTSMSIRQFVLTVKELTNATTLLNFGALPYREGEVMMSSAKIEPLLRLGWKCEYDVEKGIGTILGLEKNKL